MSFKDLSTSALIARLYFADSKALNTTLVKTAPALLASDVALQTRNSSAMYDAQLAGDRASEKAAVGALTSPAHFAASRHMNEYCGAKL